MHIKEFYHRQKTYKKPFFVLGIAFLISCIGFYLTQPLTWGDIIGGFILFLHFLDCFFVIFEVEPTEEELEASWKELEKMLAEWDKAYEIIDDK